MALLGAILVNNRAFDRVSDFLAADHFIYEPHRRIFSACRKLIETRHVADGVIVSAYLSDDDALAEAGDGYIMTLVNAAIPIVIARDYGRLIHRLYQRRELIALGDDVINRAYAAEITDDPATITRAAATALDTIRSSSPGSNRLGLVDAADMLANPIPPRGWLLGTILCRRYLTIVAAAGGSGKTSLLIAWALSLATGRNISGLHVHHRSRVMMLTFEDGADEISRRLLAACQYHKIDPTDLRGWLFFRSLTGSNRTLATMAADGTMAETTLAGDIIDEARNKQISAILADPFVKFSGAPENDNTAADFVCRLLSRIAETADIAAGVAHHARKGNHDAGDMASSRGASALVDAARVGLTMSRMTEDDAKKFSIPETDRSQYVRLDDGKTNLTLTSQTRWFRLVSVPIGNGNEEYPKGDNVQAIEPWTPPETWDGLSCKILNLILDDINAGMPDGERYSSASAARERSAWMVVRRHAPDKSEHQCREIIRTWVKNELLLVERYTSPTQRKERDGLTVDPSKRPK